MRIDTTPRSKFPRRSLQIILPLVATAWLAAPSICHATVMLTYTSNVFTSFATPYTGMDKVTASITLANPLGDNLMLSPITPLHFSISDGHQTLTDTTPIQLENFDFETNASNPKSKKSSIIVKSRGNKDFPLIYG
jgi:hypothetical protein